MSSQTVSLFYADADFANLSSGEYTAIVRHPDVNPSEASKDITIQTETEFLQIAFVYLESERIFLRVETLLASD